ncbi:MAG: sigma-70 family RNA polymerase sigma factor [Bacteroidia bacterium]|nr:sigma-70 family RNA polymerase sigma factor [Bacteroidia bacterium]
MNKKTVIQQIKTGNNDALFIIHERFRDEFISFARKRYGCGIQYAKDVYIDALLDLRNNILTGRLQKLNSSLKTYLFAIARNKITNERFRSKHFYYCNEFEESNSLYQSDGNEANENETKYRMIISMLQNLPGNCYKILKMFYFDKLSLENIASALNYSTVISLSTQKYKCHQKLKALLKSLNNDEIFIENEYKAN